MTTREWEIGQLHLRWDLVWQMAMSSLKVRIMRSFLTCLTIATATAFMAYLLSSPRQTGDPAEMQSWLLMLALALIVSGAGVLNAMLMSVAQRYREIGTIKCLGALDSLVLYSVLVESAVLGLFGAVAGLVGGLIVSLLLGMADFGLGYIGTFFVGHVPPEEMPNWLSAMFSGGMNRLLWLLGTAVFVFLVGMMLTTFGASVPAYIASRMPPVDAMRGEK